MGSFFIDSRSYSYRNGDHEVNTSDLKTDYPFKVKKWKKNRYERLDVSMVQIRRFVERKCTGDVFFDGGHNAKDGTIYEYYFDVYFEHDKDRTAFALIYGEQHGTKI